MSFLAGIGVGIVIGWLGVALLLFAGLGANERLEGDDDDL